MNDDKFLMLTSLSYLIVSFLFHLMLFTDLLGKDRQRTGNRSLGQIPGKRWRAGELIESTASSIFFDCSSRSNFTDGRTTPTLVSI